jgi:hypothetical protein
MFAEITNSLLSSVCNCLHTWGQIMHSSVFFLLGNQAVVIFFIKNFHKFSTTQAKQIFGGGGGVFFRYTEEKFVGYCFF